MLGTEKQGNGETQALIGPPAGGNASKDPGWIPSSVATVAMVVGVLLVVKTLRKRSGAAEASIEANLNAVEEGRRAVRDIEQRAAASGQRSEDREAAMQSLVRLERELAARENTLRDLIDQADTKIAALQAALARAGNGPVRREAETQAAGERRTHHQGAETEGRKSLQHSIEELHRRGVAAPEISKQVGVPTGQVELILALSRAGA